MGGEISKQQREDIEYKFHTIVSVHAIKLAEIHTLLTRMNKAAIIDRVNRETYEMHFRQINNLSIRLQEIMLENEVIKQRLIYLASSTPLSVKTPEGDNAIQQWEANRDQMNAKIQQLIKENQNATYDDLYTKMVTNENLMIIIAKRIQDMYDGLLNSPVFKMHRGHVLKTREELHKTIRVMGANRKKLDEQLAHYNRTSVNYRNQIVVRYPQIYCIGFGYA